VRRVPQLAMVRPSSEPGLPSGTAFFLLLVLVAVSAVEFLLVFAALDLGFAFALAPPLVFSVGAPSLVMR